MQLLQCSVFHNLLRTFTALQVLLDILLLIWGASEDYEIVVKTLTFGYSVWINTFFFLLFLEAVIFTTLFNLTLKMWTLFRHCLTLLCQRWNTQRWLNIVRRYVFQRWNTQRCFNFNLTLSHVATFHQPKDNIETMLKCLLG